MNEELKTNLNLEFIIWCHQADKRFFSWKLNAFAIHTYSLN